MKHCKKIKVCSDRKQIITSHLHLQKFNYWTVGLVHADWSQTATVHLQRLCTNCSPRVSAVSYRETDALTMCAVCRTNIMWQLALLLSSLYYMKQIHKAPGWTRTFRSSWNVFNSRGHFSAFCLFVCSYEISLHLYFTCCLPAQTSRVHSHTGDSERLDMRESSLG